MILLAMRHLRFHWGRSLLLCLCIFVIVGLPLVSRSVISSFESSLRDRAQTVPLLVGPAGSRFDLVLAALHWRITDLKPIPLGVVEEIRELPGTEAIPVHVRYRARGKPIAAVPYEYFEFRGLVPQEGRMIAGLGEALLGSTAAKELKLKPGDELPSDQLSSYDITAPSAVMLRIVGVLHETNTPDDRVVFVDLETAWLLEGIAHGHASASSVRDPDLLIGESEEHVALSGALIEYQRVDETTAGSFHLHEDRAELPITAILVFPKDQKDAALTRTRINAVESRQALSPINISDELIRSVLRVQRLVDVIFLIVGIAMIGLLVLVSLLTIRARSHEVRTLLDIGATRTQVSLIFLFEYASIVLVGIAGAVLAAWMSGSVSDQILNLLS
ncbi:MAG: ABC transporter permease [Phycisphaerales bacterium]|nr:ABC transporter permease [Phycisphaerales bacterium]